MTRYMPDSWPLPALDTWNRPFFGSGTIVIQECSNCGTLQHPPEQICHRCLGMEFTGHETNGEGTIYSYQVVYYPAAPALQAVVPYNVVLVSLDEHPEIRIIGNVVNRKPQDLAIGQPVRAVFEAIADEELGETLYLPQWEVVDGSTSSPGA